MVSLLPYSFVTFGVTLFWFWAYFCFFVAGLTFVFIMFHLIGSAVMSIFKRV